jgi:hypothetical protein
MLIMFDIDIHFDMLVPQLCLDGKLNFAVIKVTN